MELNASLGHQNEDKLLLNIALFSGIIESDMLLLLQCFGIKTKSYRKGSIVVPFGTRVTSIGIVLSGSVDVFREDSAGGRFLVKKLHVNSIFSEDLVCSGVKESPFSIIAGNKCEVLFLPYEKIVSPCDKACSYHKQLVKNILKVVSENNLLLNLKIDILGKRTIREKLLTYLKTQSKNQGSSQFNVSFNRNELSEFLCVDRAAMCRELSNMRNDGLIRYSKNYFEFL